MSKTAFVFPGQGAQYVGMAEDMVEHFPYLNEILDNSNKILNFDIKKLMFEGPKEKLALTANTQPAILIASVICMTPVIKEGIVPDACAGLSLGEYTAHVLSGTFSFEDAVRLVRKRGQFMQNEVPEGVGGMAVAIGMSEDDLKKCLKRAEKYGQIHFSNYNCPGQITVSGENEALAKFVEISEEMGSRKSLKLNVSAPFHSPMLKGAGVKLYEEMQNLTLNEMKIPVVSNTDAKMICEPENVKELLKKQIYNTVLWQQSVENLIEKGFDTFVEIGPGRTLKGLIRKINRKVNVYNIYDYKTLNKTLEKIN